MSDKWAVVQIPETQNGVDFEVVSFHESEAQAAAAVDEPTWQRVMLVPVWAARMVECEWLAEGDRFYTYSGV
jgi:hypothetical protein